MEKHANYWTGVGVGVTVAHPRPGIRWHCPAIPAIRLLCCIFTPLGFPVDPLVYITTARSDAVGFSYSLLTERERACVSAYESIEFGCINNCFACYSQFSGFVPSSITPACCAWQETVGNQHDILHTTACIDTCCKLETATQKPSEKKGGVNIAMFSARSTPIRHSHTCMSVAFCTLSLVCQQFCAGDERIGSTLMWLALSYSIFPQSLHTAFTHLRTHTHIQLCS